MTVVESDFVFFCGFTVRVGSRSFTIPEVRRSHLQALTTHHTFVMAVLVCISASSVLLAMDSPASPLPEWFMTVDACLTVLFTLEALLKALAQGGREYIKDSWNQLDCLVVTEAWAAIIFSTGGGFKTLRVLRVLRPLRTIERMPSLRVLTNALVASIETLVDVFVVLFFVMSLFGVVAVLLWHGSFQYRCGTNSTSFDETMLCRFDNSEDYSHCPAVSRLTIGETGDNCPSGLQCVYTGENPNYGHTSFDHLGASLVALFQVFTLEGWGDIVTMTVAAHNNTAWLFFVFVVIVGSCMLMQLLGAIILSSLQRQMDHDDMFDADLSEEEEEDEEDELAADAESHDLLPEGMVLARHLNAVRLEEGFETKVRENEEEDEGGEEPIPKRESLSESSATFQRGKTLSRLGVWSKERPKRGSQRAVDMQLSEDFERMSELDRLEALEGTLPDSRMLRARRRTVAALERSRKRMQIQPSKFMMRIRDAAVWEKIHQKHEDIMTVLNTPAVVFLPNWMDKERIMWEVNDDNAWFSIFILACIIANIFTLAMSSSEATDEQVETLGLIEMTFNIVFVVEMFLKILTLGIEPYWKNNQLDCIITVFGFVDVLFQAQENTGVSVLRVLRVARVARMSRLAKRMRSMTKVIRMLKSVIKPTLNVCVLLVLFMFVFSILGMQLFARPNGAGEERYHFQHFGAAFVSVFVMLTGETWPAIMFSALEGRNLWYSLYFVVWTVLGNYFLLNLVLATLFSRATDVVDRKMHQLKEASMLTVDAMREAIYFRHLFKRWKKLATVPRVNFWDHLAVRLDMIHAFRRWADGIGGFRAPRDPVAYMTEAWRQRKVVVRGRAYSITYSSFTRDKLPLHVGISRAVCRSHGFQNFVTTMVSINTFMLTFQDWNIGNFGLEVVMTMIYLSDIVFKIVGYGWNDPHERHSFARSNWNLLDLLVVVASTCWVLAKLGGAGSGVLAVLSVLRGMRPFRLLSRIPGSRFLVTTVANSFAKILDILLLLFAFCVVAALIGQQLFTGTFYYCELGDDSLTPYPAGAPLWDRDTDDVFNVTGFKHGCRTYQRADNTSEVYTARSADYNYDAFGQSIITTLLLVLLEDWPTVALNAIDSTGEEYTEPREGQSKGAIVFFMLVIIFGNFLFLQVFIAVLFEQYMLLRCMKDGTVVTPHQLKQIEFEDRLIVDIGPPKHLPEPQSRLSKWARAVTEHRYFIRLDTTVVALNIAVLLTTHESQSDGFTAFQESVGVVCAIAFITELALQLISVGPSVYFSTAENYVNAIVTLVSLADVYVTLTTNIHCAAQAALLKVIRCLRVMRVVKLVAFMPSVRVVLIALLRPMPTLLSLVLIIVVTIISWSNCGYILFGGAHHEQFETMGESIKTLVYAATGEVWTDTFTIAMDLNPDLPRWLWVLMTVTFFYSFMLVTSLLMLNMFIMVVVDSYDLVSDGAWGLDQVEILAFKSAWLRIDKDNTGLATHNDIVRMVRRLPNSLLGIDEGKLATYKQCFYYVKELNLENFQTARQLYEDKFPNTHEMQRRDGKIHFHKVLLAVNRLAYKRKQFEEDAKAFHGLNSKISERSVMEEKAAFIVMRAIQSHIFRQRCSQLTDSIRSAKERDGQSWRETIRRRISAGEFSPGGVHPNRSPDHIAGADEIESPNPSMRLLNNGRGSTLRVTEPNRALAPEFDEETKAEELTARLSAARDPQRPESTAISETTVSPDASAPPQPPTGAPPSDGKSPTLSLRRSSSAPPRSSSGRRGPRRLKKPAKATHKPAHTPSSTPRTTPLATPLATPVASPRGSFSGDAQFGAALAAQLTNLPGVTPRQVSLGVEIPLSPALSSSQSSSYSLPPSRSSPSSRLRQLARPAPGSGDSSGRSRRRFGEGGMVSSPTSGSPPEVTL